VWHTSAYETLAAKCEEGYVEHTSLPMKLRVLRAERQLSLREASARTGVDKVALSRYERGLGRPQDLTLAKIAKGYDGAPNANGVAYPAVWSCLPCHDEGGSRGSLRRARRYRG
jgi:transcriptional regulator with XRE-family HTH domain